MMPLGRAVPPVSTRAIAAIVLVGSMFMSVSSQSQP